MPTTATRRYTGYKLQPAQDPEAAREMNVNLAANLNLLAGTILAELAATRGTYVPYNSVLVTVPAAPTVTNGASGSPGWPASAINVYATYSTAGGGETTPSLATAFTPTVGDKLHVAAYTLPYGVTGVNFYVGASAATATLIGSSATGAAADYDKPATAGALAPTANNAYTSGLLAPPTAAPTLTDSSGAGAIPAGSYAGVVTYLTAGGETTASPAGHFTSAGTKKIHVAGITLPAGATGMNFYAGLEGDAPSLWGTSTTGNAADYDLPTTAALEPPRTNTAAVTDGSQVPRGILAEDATTDASGNITRSSVAATLNEFGTTELSVPMFYRGTFFTKDLHGLDTTAVGQLGRLAEGTVADGLLEVI